MLHAPGLKAFGIQCAAFLLTFLLFCFIEISQQARWSILAAGLLQGVVAAAISRFFKLAVWWLYIQLLFPVLLLATLSLHLPPSIFLAAFIFLLGLYWTTFRTQVPFYPSGRFVWKAIDSFLPKEKQIEFVDIGSGFGGLILHLARLRQDSRFTGIEVAPLPWIASCCRAWMAGSLASFVRGDYAKLNFRHYDVVFAYLSPAAMPALWAKANAEMRSGALLLSYEFCIEGVDPHLIINSETGDATLFGWYF